MKLVTKSYKEKTVIEINDVKIGNGFIIIAGPCAIENKKQFFETAEIVKRYAHILRAHIFKPRTSPYSFQGLGEEGLELLKEVKEFELPLITEIMELKHVDLLMDYVDIFQIGARNMQNFPLLKKVGRTEKPILLKRGLSATVEEWLLSAEYILREGNENVILCERGIRTFETATRNTLDLSAVPLIKEISHLPIIVDPSHATGKRSLVPAMSKAALACGSDGLMIEVHPNPQEALSDKEQQLDFKEFEKLMVEIKEIVRALGNKV